MFLIRDPIKVRQCNLGYRCSGDEEEFVPRHSYNQNRLPNLSLASGSATCVDEGRRVGVRSTKSEVKIALKDAGPTHLHNGYERLKMTTEG